MSSVSTSQVPARKPAALLPILAALGLSAGVVVATRKLFTPEFRPRRTDVRGKVILITGGSRGLGFAMAQDFGREGAILALAARDGSELEKACRQLHSEGAEAHAFAQDISDPEQARQLVERVIGQLGRIDILVNNAGVIKVAPMASFDHAEYERAMNLMFWAPVNLSLAVLPHMQERGEGAIVNVTSVGGRVSIPHLLPYSCAKFALVGFSTGMASEVKAKGIHVLTVVPGLMRTGSYLNAEFAGDEQHEFAWFGILGNLPGFSVGADYAAAEIRRALEQRRHDLTISLPAQILVAIEALLPDLMRTILATADRFLPSGENKSGARGKQLNPAFGKLFELVTTLGRQAAARWNEHPARV